MEESPSFSLEFLKQIHTFAQPETARTARKGKLHLTDMVKVVTNFSRQYAQGSQHPAFSDIRADMEKIQQALQKGEYAFVKGLSASFKRECQKVSADEKSLATQRRQLADDQKALQKEEKRLQLLNDTLKKLQSRHPDNMPQETKLKEQVGQLQKTIEANRTTLKDMEAQINRDTTTLKQNRQVLDSIGKSIRRWEDFKSFSRTERHELRMAHEEVMASKDIHGSRWQAFKLWLQGAEQNFGLNEGENEHTLRSLRLQLGQKPSLVNRKTLLQKLLSLPEYQGTLTNQERAFNTLRGETIQQVWAENEQEAIQENVDCTALLQREPQISYQNDIGSNVETKFQTLPKHLIATLNFARGERIGEIYLPHLENPDLSNLEILAKAQLLKASEMPAWTPKLQAVNKRLRQIQNAYNKAQKKYATLFRLSTTPEVASLLQIHVMLEINPEASFRDLQIQLNTLSKLSELTIQKEEESQLFKNLSTTTKQKLQTRAFDKLRHKLQQKADLSTLQSLYTWLNEQTQEEGEYNKTFIPERSTLLKVIISRMEEEIKKITADNVYYIQTEYNQEAIEGFKKSWEDQITKSSFPPEMQEFLSQQKQKITKVREDRMVELNIRALDDFADDIEEDSNKKELLEAAQTIEDDLEEYKPSPNLTPNQMAFNTRRKEVLFTLWSLLVNMECAKEKPDADTLQDYAENLERLKYQQQTGQTLTQEQSALNTRIDSLLMILPKITPDDIAIATDGSAPQPSDVII